MKTNKIIFVVILFAIAMGLLETSVVVYLRELYYPEGFSFPIKKIPANISIVEISREAATIIMLIGVGILAGKDKVSRFAYFMLAFAIWDLFYYIFLYVFISWPESLFTWDLLFLIPIPWVGPVWAPCLISMLMITFSILLIRAKDQNKDFKLKKKNVWLFILGGLVCILSFVWDFLQNKNPNFNLLEILSNPEKSDFIYKYIPTQFNHFIFFLGFILMTIGALAQFIYPLIFVNHEKK